MLEIINCGNLKAGSWGKALIMSQLLTRSQLKGTVAVCKMEGKQGQFLKIPGCSDVISDFRNSGSCLNLLSLALQFCVGFFAHSASLH